MTVSEETTPAGERRGVSVRAFVGVAAGLLALLLTGCAAEARSDTAATTAASTTADTSTSLTDDERAYLSEVRAPGASVPADAVGDFLAAGRMWCEDRTSGESQDNVELTEYIESRYPVVAQLSPQSRWIGATGHLCP